MRRAGILGALLATAALLCALPGLMRIPAAQNRTAPSLQVPQLRTLTVWLLPGDVGDQKLLNQLCAAFEKEHKGVRVFLRSVTADEFEGETTVLPDAALFVTGELNTPERYFLPLMNADHPSGQYAGVQYAVPLWLSPNVLSVPKSWLNQTFDESPGNGSLLASSTAVPRKETARLLTANDLPWDLLLQKNAVEKPQGIGWQQLLAICPNDQRAQLAASMLDTTNQSSPTAVPAKDWVTTVPYSRTASPTPAPNVSTPAKVESLAKHLKNEASAAFVFPLATSDRVRYIALCKENKDVQAFVQFLLTHQGDALSHALIPPHFSGDSPDPLLQALILSFRNCALPNAFAHTRQEILQLCADGFTRCEDPVRTLLTLR